MAPPNPSANFPFYLVPAPLDPNPATLYGHHHPLQPQGMFPPPTQPTPTSDSSVDSPVAGASGDPSRASSSTKAAGKRPAKDSDSSRKKLKQDHDGDDDGDHDGKDGNKVKATRGSRACTVCRRLKMKCVGAEQGPPCKRCEAGGHECVFEESNRGKRSTKKSEALQRSLTKMEKTLDVVLRSLGNPALQNLADNLRESSHSPSPAGGEDPPHLAQQTANLMSPSPSTQTPDTGMQHAIPRSESGMSNRLYHSASASVFERPPSPKLDSLPDSTLNPLGLLADTSLAHRREKDTLTEDDHVREMLPKGSIYKDPSDAPKVGLANDRYFKPGPMTILPLRRLYIERQIQPEMLTFVSKEEVVDLFKIYFEHMNMTCCMLDPAWHTPSLVCSRSPFLLTAICAVSSKFYPSRPDLHKRLNKIARKLAFSVPEMGFKSVEIVQAYLMAALWGVGPVERFEQEHTWLLLGLAIRMATDINLHRKIPYATEDTDDARATNLEIRNRERTWLLCYALDRSCAAQMGKPHSIKEDFIIRNATQWWQHPQALTLDPGLVAYVEYQRALSRSLDFLYSGTMTPTGLQTDCDYLLIIKTVETQLNSWIEIWSFHNRDALAQNVIDRVIEYRGLIAQFYYHYANLVINSFGLQNALERSAIDIAHFFGRCHSSATSCARIVKDELAPKGYLRYSPDSTFVFFSYAVLTLLKLIRTEFRSFIQDEKAILDLVIEVADQLEAIAVGPYHTPALYSTFLRALVTTKSGESRAATPDLSNGPGDAPMSNASGDHPVSDPPVPGASEKGSTPARDGAMNTYNLFNNYAGEMGPAQVQDINAFPPTFAAPDPDEYNMFSMDNILGDGFWDSVLIPGYSNSFEGLAGGVVYGAGGSGFITPKRTSPQPSGTNSPIRGLHQFT